MKTLSPLLHALKLLEASCSPEQTENLSYPCAMLHKTFWVFDHHCLDHMTSHISSSSRTTVPTPTQSYTHHQRHLGDCGLYVGLVSSWEWILGAGVLSVFGDAMPSYFQILSYKREKEGGLDSLRVVNFYSVTPALYSTLLTATSCGWWWYHLIVKGNCSVFWFYVWIWSLAPLDRISF